MNYNPLHKITEALNALPSAASTSSSGELNTLLQGIDYVYRQNRQLNLELAESKDAKRSVVLVNFIKGRYPTKESLKPLCESLGVRVDHPFYAVWLVNFFPSSRLSPIDEEMEAILNRSQKDLDIYSTELLTSNMLAVVSFFDTPQSTGQEYEKAVARYNLDRLSALTDEDALHLYEIYYSMHTANSPNSFESCSRQLLQIAGEISQAHAAIQNPEVADLLPIGLCQDIQKICLPNV